MDENKRAAEMALIAGPAKHLAELVQPPPVTAEDLAAIDVKMSSMALTPLEVAPVRRPTQGAASGAVNLPEPGAASGLDHRPLDIEAIDYDEVRRQINSEHQGPWFSIRPNLRLQIEIGAMGYAALVYMNDGEAGDVSLVVGLGYLDCVAAVLSPDVLDTAAVREINRQIDAQIEKQKQCRAECRRVGCGCQC